MNARHLSQALLGVGIHAGGRKQRRARGEEVGNGDIQCTESRAGLARLIAAQSISRQNGIPIDSQRRRAEHTGKIGISHGHHYGVERNSGMGEGLRDQIQRCFALRRLRAHGDAYALARENEARLQQAGCGSVRLHQRGGRTLGGKRNLAQALRRIRHRLLAGNGDLRAHLHRQYKILGKREHNRWIDS